MLNDLTSQTSGGSSGSSVRGNHIDTLTSITPVGHDNFRGRVMARRALYCTDARDF